MSYRIRMKVKGRAGTRVSVEAGTIFEVTNLSPNAPQTLRVTIGKTLILDTDNSQVFDLETECLNPSRRAPSNDPMRLTPFVKP
jgi:hypothetical protein